MYHPWSDTSLAALLPRTAVCHPSFMTSHYFLLLLQCSHIKKPHIQISIYNPPDCPACFPWKILKGCRVLSQTRPRVGCFESGLRLAGRGSSNFIHGGRRNTGSHRRADLWSQPRRRMIPDCSTCLVNDENITVAHWCMRARVCVCDWVSVWTVTPHWSVWEGLCFDAVNCVCHVVVVHQ